MFVRREAERRSVGELESRTAPGFGSLDLGLGPPFFEIAIADHHAAPPHCHDRSIFVIEQPKAKTVMAIDHGAIIDSTDRVIRGGIATLPVGPDQG